MAITLIHISPFVSNTSINQLRHTGKLTHPCSTLAVLLSLYPNLFAQADEMGMHLSQLSKHGLGKYNSSPGCPGNWAHSESKRSPTTARAAKSAIAAVIQLRAHQFKRVASGFPDNFPAFLVKRFIYLFLMKIIIKKKLLKIWKTLLKLLQTLTKKTQQTNTKTLMETNHNALLSKK